MKKSIGSGRGSVYNIILKALQSGDKYGYEICKEIEEKTDGAYILKQPSLYSGLKRLEAQGDVKSYWKDSALGGRRHYYSLTQSGLDRIEASNFNWQDARDDIVGSLFEKSALDKVIESAENDINEIKSIDAFSKQTQQNIEDIISETEYLANNKEVVQEDANIVNDQEVENDLENQQQNNDIEYKEQSVDYMANDLFSMFSTVNSASEKEQAHSVEIDSSDKFDEKNPEQEQEQEQEQETLPKELESKEELNNEQIDLFSYFNNSQKTEAEDVEVELKNTEEAKESDNFADIENNLKTFDNYKDETDFDKKEELTEDLQLNGEEKVEETNKQDDETALDNLTEDELKLIFAEENDNKEDLINTTLTNDTQGEEVILEKNQDDIFDEYKEKNVTYGTYIDNSALETEDSDIYNNLKTEESILLNADVNENATEKVELKGFEAENEQLQLDAQNNEQEIKHENESTRSVDYKDIFGDLISQQSNYNIDKNAELDDEFVYENTNIEHKVETKPDESLIKQDLPRNDDALTDINRTLMFDKSNKSQESFSSNNFEKYDQTPFKEGTGFAGEKQNNNPFEKYSTYQNINEVNHAETQIEDVHNSKTNNLSFDKKYANTYNRFEVPDYEVRYFRKNNVQNNNSKFISINKLNLTNSFILSILMCVVTTLCLVLASTKGQVAGFQIFVFVVSYLICFGTLIINFFKYHFNKNKKVQKLKKPESMYLSFIAIVIITLAIAINLLAGMNFDNIAGFVGSFVLPIFYALILLLNYPLKKFLSKFASFYN